MKYLISIINRYFIISSLILFLIIYIVIYYLIDISIRKESDQQLKNITKKVVNELKRGGVVDYPPFIEIERVKTNTISNSHNYFEDVFIDFEESEDEPFRQMISYAQIDGKHYKIIARISMEAKIDMFKIISIVIFSGIFTFLITMFFINRKLSAYVLSDLYITLKKISEFSITGNKKLELQSSQIYEFNKLNSAIDYLAEKAQKEYNLLKEFTEEINHEIQTPLSVIKSKLELLVQSSIKDENDIAALDSAMKSLHKLERVNKSLLLLNKLENPLLFENSSIDIKEEINKILDNFNDFIKYKRIKLKCEYNTKNKPIFLMNQSLLNILLSNLLSNAIKYCLENGEISVSLNDLQDKLCLTISNSSTEPTNIDNFFNRFYKESLSPESTGLGLAIVKKICDIYQIKIANNYQNGIYTIKLFFNTKKNQ